MSLFKASMEIAQEYARLCGYVPAITLHSFLQFPLFNSPTLWYDTDIVLCTVLKKSKSSFGTETASPKSSCMIWWHKSIS
jgi:hypothetical protein